MLLDEKVCEDVKLKLQPDDFYHHRHRIIYEAMLTLLEQNKGVDVTTVTAFLQDHKRISEIGGVEYILTIYESVATTAHTDHYIDMVLEKSISRLIINRAQELIEQGYSPETSTQDLIDAAEQKFSGLSRLNQGSDFKEINNVLVDFIKNVEKLSQSTGEVTGLTTGYTALDDITCLLYTSDAADD